MISDSRWVCWFRLGFCVCYTVNKPATITRWTRPTIVINKTVLTIHNPHKHLLASHAHHTLHTVEPCIHCIFVWTLIFQIETFFFSDYMEIAMFCIASLNFGPLTTSRGGGGGSNGAQSHLKQCYRYSNRVAKLIPSSAMETKKNMVILFGCERIQHTHTKEKKRMEQHK